MLPRGIDHLIYATANLQRGMDEIEKLFGVRPAAGGRHPQYGTHNAILSLGSSTYLEIIARDPALPAPARGALVDIPAGGDSRLATWVFRPGNIHDFFALATEADIGLGSVDTGTREGPDGRLISWQLTDPYAMPMNGAVPFLIHWGNTAHPSSVAPAAGQLLELAIEHRQAKSVRHAISVIGANVKVESGDTFRLSARIDTHNGIVTLR